MSLILKPHPEGFSAAVFGVQVDVGRAADVLRLRYALTGALGRVRWPEPSAPERADELWKSTCLEAFVRGPEGESYLELNFAPSRRWAAYAFDGYRTGMRNADVAAEPAIVAGGAEHGSALEASVDLRGLLPADASWRLGLSAVIEDADGAKSYWALRHPPGKPDFHHPDSFALTLEVP